ncbi:hypothetical protein ACIRPX_34005 [Streptomyces sp. NPDC101225]|uniref:hypothetical protein n=1 Tax=Streptomyces sp. NPDC101225 TaxID=3366135 RepID=UPI0037F8169A
MSQLPVSSELTSQYAAQVTGDLERNVKEQDRVGAEIADLQAQLAALQHDHTVLLNMHQALGVTPAPAEPPAPPAAARTRARARTRKAGTSPRRAATRGPAARKAAPAAGKAGPPTLVDLARGHLAEVREPRSTAEIAAALTETHPGRTFKNTVVRTTAEGLVAKGLAQRTKQGGSVYYTAPDPDRSGGSRPPSDTE